MTSGRLQNVVLVHIVHISVETVATCQFLLVSSACQQTFNCIKCLIIHSLCQSLFKLVHQYDYLTVGSFVFLHTLYTCTLLVLHILSHSVLSDGGTACTCASAFFHCLKPKDVFHFANEVKINVMLKVWHEGLIFIRFFVVFIAPCSYQDCTLSYAVNHVVDCFMVITFRMP